MGEGQYFDDNLNYVCMCVHVRGRGLGSEKGCNQYNPRKGDIKPRGVNLRWKNDEGYREGVVRCLKRAGCGAQASNQSSSEDGDQEGYGLRSSVTEHGGMLLSSQQWWEA